MRYDPVRHITRAEAMDVLNVSYKMFPYYESRGVLEQAGRVGQTVFYQRDLVEALAADRDVVSVANWHEGIEAYHRGQRVTGVEITADSRYYIIETEGGLLERVYCKTMLLTR